jgi:hypothetical protein
MLPKLELRQGFRVLRVAGEERAGAAEIAA